MIELEKIRKVVIMSNLTFYERQQIELLLKTGLSKRDIAKRLCRNHSVIIRETNRNVGDYFPYDARTAQEAANRRSKKTNKRKLDKDKILYEYVVDRLKDDWSPEQIAGRLKERPPRELLGKYISHEQIYQYIYNGDRDSYGELLYKYLRSAKPTRQKRYTRKSRKLTISDRTSIHERPEEINLKTKYGHWESDSVICKGHHGISVQYERKSMLTRIHKLPNLKAESTEQAIIQTIDSLPLYLVKTITFDNGTENVNHTKLKENFPIQTYFCDPYSSWQKGGVENTNGLIRQYLPRKTELDKITDEDINTIEELLNNRPRKSLDYLTPNEIINNESGALNS